MHTAYTALLEKIDRRLQQMPACACPAGCDLCCRLSFTLFPVEAFHLRGAFLRLPGAAAERVRRQAADPHAPGCPLLLDGRCAVYEARPVLCRTHGVPFFRRGEGEAGPALYPGCEHLPLAAPAGPGSGTRKVPALDLDGINELLVRVNERFCRDGGGWCPESSRRISVREVPGPGFPGGEAHADL